MNYIIMLVCLENLQYEWPFIYPNNLVHSDMAEMATKIIEQTITEKVVCTPIAAGSINFLKGITCEGRSRTLNLESRGETDEKLITLFNYTKGIPL